MGRPILPENQITRDSILWVLRDGMPRTCREMTVMIGGSPSGRRMVRRSFDGVPVQANFGEGEPGDFYEPNLPPQIQALCNRGDLERVQVNRTSVAYRRVVFDDDLEAAWKSLVAASVRGEPE